MLADRPDGRRLSAEEQRQLDGLEHRLLEPSAPPRSVPAGLAAARRAQELQVVLPCAVAAAVLLLLAAVTGGPGGMAATAVSLLVTAAVVLAARRRPGAQVRSHLPPRWARRGQPR